MPETDTSKPNFALHAHSLGVLCIAWATLDRHLTDLLADMVPCSRAAAACLAMQENVAPRCETLKKLAYERGYQREWCELLGKLLDNIVNNIGRRRNRFVHDYWTTAEGELERLDKRARLESQGADMGKGLVFETWHKHLPEEVTNLTVEVTKAIIFVQMARSDVLNRSGRGPLPEPTSLGKMAALIVPPAPPPPEPSKPPPPPQS